jgi:cytoskeletal protein CcmA (bactofilin family)
MSNRSFGPIGDYRVSSLSCYDHTVLDGLCNLDVANVRALTICADALKARKRDQPLRILSNIYAEGTLYVAGDVLFDSNLAVKNTLIVDEELIVTGNTDLSGNIFIDGNIKLTGNTMITGNTMLSGNTIISGNLCVIDQLIVKGPSMLDDLVVTGGATIEDDLLVEGNLCVAQDSYFKGNVYFSSLPKLWQATANSGQMIVSGSTGNIIAFDWANPYSVNVPGTWNGSTDFTVDSNGWYRLEAAMDLGTMIDNKFGLDFLVDGMETGNLCIGDSRLHSTALPARIHLNCTSYLLGNSVVSVRGRQTTGSSHSLVGASITIERIC